MWARLQNLLVKQSGGGMGATAWYHYRKDWLTHGRFQPEMLHLFRNRKLHWGRGHKISQAVKLLVAFKPEAHNLAGFSVLLMFIVVNGVVYLVGQETRLDYGYMSTGLMTPDFNLDEWFPEAIPSFPRITTTFAGFIRKSSTLNCQEWKRKPESVSACVTLADMMQRRDETSSRGLSTLSNETLVHGLELILILHAPKNRWKSTLVIFAWFGLAAPLCGAKEPNFSPVLCLIMCVGGPCCSVMVDYWIRTQNKFLCCRSNVWDLLATKCNTTVAAVDAL